MNIIGEEKRRRTFDVIVIGSGITGGWAAKEFCEHGFKTLLIERGRMVRHIVDYPTAMKAPWEFRHRNKLPENFLRENPIVSKCYAVDESTQQFFVKDAEHPYIQEKPFDWIRGYQVGGKSLIWARQTQRWSDFEFEAPARDGFAVDWPIRYKDLEFWYSYVEKFIGISGNKDHIINLPDSEVLPPFELNCVEKHIQKKIHDRFLDRHVIIGRCAHLTQPQKIHIKQGRNKCQARNLCYRGCPFGAYFSSNSSTIPWAERTGNLTILTDHIVHSIIYDERKAKATGVKTIDAETKEMEEYYANVIFVNASTLNTNLILLNSTSNRFPNGLGNDNDLLGHYIAFHNYRGNITATFEGYADSYYYGRRPTTAFMPSFRNVFKQETDFLRGYMIAFSASRQGWERGYAQEGFGMNYKEQISKPGIWNVFMMMQGETIPKYENHVRLSKDQFDSYGIPQLIISVDYDENDMKLMRDFLNQGAEMLEKAGCKNIHPYDTHQAPGLDIHEMGGVRMGNDPRTSLLNKWNQLHQCKNVFVTDGACMTSVGNQNPSLTFMALTARAANYAINQLKKGALLIILLISIINIHLSYSQHIFHDTVDVLVVGGGTGGVAAGIESARNGVTTIIVESTPWLGGMLTAAGVSATDGNDNLYSGIWEEFRQALYQHYGKKENLQTGWVSNTLFEPHVGDSIFKSMAQKEKTLKVIYGYDPDSVLKLGNKIIGVIFKNKENKKLVIYAKIIIDATELGDVFAMAGCTYFIGMDSKAQTGEPLALDTPNHIIQDLTYVAILKDYGTKKHNILSRPTNYDPSMFFCSCKSTNCLDGIYSCDKMLSYGKLPNNKYMINWPLYGNDIYINVVDSNSSTRKKYYQIAKDKTLSFIYYIQHDLGYTNLGLADDEFPTRDLLPFIPYNREGRRVQGLVQMKLQDLENRYRNHLYRTGIAVGDYPIDQHHSENRKAPLRNFPHIPSFSVPLGCLIPKHVEGLIVAEKGISVTNIVNGATRLQPCVLLVGQAAGALAALSIKQRLNPDQIPVREVQELLLDHHAYIIPTCDVSPKDSTFKSIQRIAATGILKVFGVPYQWENQSWFYPKRSISEYELMQGFRDFYQKGNDYYGASGANVTLSSFARLCNVIGYNIDIQKAKETLSHYYPNTQIMDNTTLNREMVAVLVDACLDPFHLPINMKGDRTAQ